MSLILHSLLNWCSSHRSAVALWQSCVKGVFSLFFSHCFRMHSIYYSTPQHTVLFNPKVSSVVFVLSSWHCKKKKKSYLFSFSESSFFIHLFSLVFLIFFVILIFLSHFNKSYSVVRSQWVFFFIVTSRYYWGFETSWLVFGRVFSVPFVHHWRERKKTMVLEIGK